jgi:hypothetical protein
MKKPKKSKPTLAETAAAYQKAFLPHPQQAELINAAVKLLADDVVNAATSDAPVTAGDAMAGACAEFDTGLLALIYPPDADHFIAIWSSPEWSRILKPYLNAAWRIEPGAYGARPPVSYDPTRNPLNLH